VFLLFSPQKRKKIITNVQQNDNNKYNYQVVPITSPRSENDMNLKSEGVRSDDEDEVFKYITK